MKSEPIWKAWFAKHGAKLLLFARQQARYPDDAEDLVQEAFVRIWRLYGHTGEVSPSLVYRAIRRLAIDWARSLDRRKSGKRRFVPNLPSSILSTAALKKTSARWLCCMRSNACLPSKKRSSPSKYGRSSLLTKFPVR